MKGACTHTQRISTSSKKCVANKGHMKNSTILEYHSKRSAHQTLEMLRKCDQRKS